MSKIVIDNEDDYKYCLSEMSSTNIGARNTYADIMMSERAPFKFQQILRIYILRELELERGKNADNEKLVLGEHLFDIKKDTVVYDVFSRLKIKVRFYEPKSSGGYTYKSLKFADFIKYIEDKDDAREELFIQEINISNLALMTFTL